MAVVFFVQVLRAPPGLGYLAQQGEQGFCSLAELLLAQYSDCSGAIYYYIPTATPNSNAMISLGAPEKLPASFCFVIRKPICFIMKQKNRSKDLLIFSLLPCYQPKAWERSQVLEYLTLPMDG